jgi:hypothetical protein
MYGSILAWCAELASADPVMSQYMIDAYAAQHPTNTDRRNRQSVAVHLMSLCAAPLGRDLFVQPTPVGRSGGGDCGLESGGITGGWRQFQGEE